MNDTQTKERTRITRTVTKKETVFTTNTGVAKLAEQPPVLPEKPYFILKAPAPGEAVSEIREGSIIIPDPKKVRIVDRAAFDHMIYSLIVTYGRGWGGPMAVTKVGKLFGAQTHAECQEIWGEIKREFLARQHLSEGGR